MKYLVVIYLLGFLLVVHAADMPRQSRYEVAASPADRFIALSAIGFDEVSPSVRMRLRVLVVNVVTVNVEQIFTWLKPPWAVGWSSDKTLLVCGSRDEDEKEEKLVVIAYDIDKSGRVIERVPTEEEKKKARENLDTKQKRPSQSAQTTPGLAPSCLTSIDSQGSPQWTPQRRTNGS